LADNPRPEHNQLLAALSPAVRERLSPALELVDLEAGRVIFHLGEPITHAYFPVDSILSTTHQMEDGETTEILIVGNDGFAGTSLLLGAETTPNRTVVQGAGRAYRLTRRAITAEFDRHGEAYDLFLRYIHWTLTKTAQSVLCHRYHSIEQQLCRWLLLSIDRVRGNTLRMTQQLIARILDVRCERVTHAATALQSLGLISCQSDIITVLDRAGIERRCCECYVFVKREGRRVLGQATSGLEMG
jgi:CRP-like cAMP-binding protein